MTTRATTKERHGPAGRRNARPGPGPDDQLGGDQLGGDQLGGDQLGGDQLGGDQLGGDQLGEGWA